MTKLFSFALLITLALQPLSTSAELINGIAAIVNDDIITIYDVDKETAIISKEAVKLATAAPPITPELRALALNRLIDQKLTDHKITELGIIISEEELRQYIEDVKKQNHIGTQEALVAALLTQGLTYDQYRKQLREQMERIRLMSQEVRSKIQIGEKEIKEYYDANRAKYGEEELFQANHIFFRLDKNANATETKRVMTTALTVLTEARNGKDFAELAKKYSDDPNAGKDGGEMVPFRKGEMISEIDSAVLAMKSGDISELVSTPEGFHIFKLTDRFIDKPKPFETVKGEIEDILYREKSEERFSQWVKELRKNAAIEIK
ncbi:MAG: peptidylprolyl isomerase [Geobacteraceae bacterium]